MKKGLAVCFLAVLLISGCAALQTDQRAQNEVVIKRDNYGVPHIYAQTVYGLFYGYGYAIAQDRLFSMEMARYSGQGRVSEFLGEKYIDFDKKTRANYKPESIKTQLGSLSQQDKDVFSGYAAGINAYLEQAGKQPEALMPRQFSEFGFEPQAWTAFDVAMVFVGSMVNRFGDFNTELANLHILKTLEKQHGKEKGRQIFNQIIPQTVQGTPTTIAADEWNVSSRQIGEFLSKTDSTPAFITDHVLDYPDRLHASAFSNMVIIGKKKAQGADAIMMNGPQFGWYTPSYVYSIGLHGAGFDLVGNTPYGYPAILFGHNKHISWGSTWGAGDLIDVYQEKLNPQNPEQYFFQGKYIPMEKRKEVINAKDGQDVELWVYRTVHGPVINMDAVNHVAFAKKRTWEGLEIATLLGWMHSARATDYKDWLKQTERSALNINMYYAVDKGNIGYVFTGKYPDRKPGHDNRLPVSGQGEMEWEGIHSFDYNPKVYNPEQGYIVNWNNRPAQGVLNPDMFWYSWSKADRVEVLMDAVQSKEKLSADEVWDLIRTSSVADVNAKYFIPFIVQAAGRTENGDVKKAAQALGAWDHLSKDVDKDGRYDELSTAVFRTFLPIMLDETLEDDLGDIFKFFASAGYPTPQKPMTSSLNIQIGVKTIVESMLDSKSDAYDFFNGEKPEDVVLRAMEKTVQSLEKRFGPDMDYWRLPSGPVVFTSKNFLGIPQSGVDEEQKLSLAMNRGTENDMIVFSSRTIEGYEVTPPGQSAFISQNGVKSQHYDDQLQMYADFTKKRMWLYPQDVENNKESEIVLKY